MTKKECLKKMVAVWGYLLRNPSAEKKTAYKALGLKKDKFWCPCCEYTVKKGQIRCGLCPLKDFWPERKCVSAESPFIRWRSCQDDFDAQEAAGEILDAAQYKLDDL